MPASVGIRQYKKLKGKGVMITGTVPEQAAMMTIIHDGFL
jgi:hypothetical protein